MVYLLAHLRCRAGDHHHLMAAAKTMIDATRLEPGCILYDLNISVSDPQSMVFVEKWQSREALSLHFETPHMQAWRAASKGYFIERNIEIIHPGQIEIL